MKRHEKLCFNSGSFIEEHLLFQKLFSFSKMFLNSKQKVECIDFIMRHMFLVIL